MNNYIFYLLHNLAFHHLWMDSLIRFLAVPFIYIVITLVTIILIIKYKIFIGEWKFRSLLNKSRDTIIIISITGLTYILANVLKFVFHTDRPFVALSNIRTLIPESGYAFPSGHSATIAAFAFAVFFKDKRLGYLCFIAMLLIGLARVASGVHFPVDIIGGYVIGFLVAYLLKTL